MTKLNFILNTLGLPWVNRASSFEACDCYGLVKLFYKEVLNINLSEVKGYKSGECNVNSGFMSVISDWVEIKNPIDSCVFISFRDGKADHVGIMIDKTNALHSRGSLEEHGKVEIHNIKTLESMYTNIKYFKHKNQNA